MTEYIRARQKGDPGHEITVRADRFDAEALVKLDKNPLGTDGLPLRPTFRTTVTKAAGKKKAPAAEKPASPNPDSE